MRVASLGLRVVNPDGDTAVVRTGSRGVLAEAVRTIRALRASTGRCGRCLHRIANAMTADILVVAALARWCYDTGLRRTCLHLRSVGGTHSACTGSGKREEECERPS